ncbi:MAG: MerR family transcriptional regulator [Lachnospiraceae bacterium]|nr:MerR family transcriptional regulator [Lachnospiraceae bacterium]
MNHTDTINRTFSTSDIANIIGIHPNTVRLYEDLYLITKPKRRENGYRVFTMLHIIQFKIARLAFEVEVLQNGLRKQAVDIVKACAACNFDKALTLSSLYLNQIKEEKENAEEAIRIADRICAKKQVSSPNNGLCLTRKQTADYLHITIDTLRNWELNGLFTIKRKKNGYRVYTEDDIRQLIMIKSLRCANYSLSAILRMLHQLSLNPDISIRDAIETPPDDDIVTACDHLITSLNHAEENMEQIRHHIHSLKKLPITNTPL